MQEYMNYIQNLTIWDYVATGVVSVVVFVWAWSILWTTKDISARTDNIIYQLFSILVVAWLTPIIGLPLYILLRPLRYKHESDSPNDYYDLNLITCEKCENNNLKEFDFCIFCGNWLKVKCKECKNNYPKEYEYCSSCWAPNIE